MNIGDKLAAELREAGHEVAGWFDRDGQPNAAPLPSFTPAPSAPSQQSQPEVHMSVSALLQDAEKAATALVGHVKTLAGNPLVDAIVEAGAGLLLTPAEVAAIKIMIQALEADRAPAAATAGAAQGVAQAFQTDGAQQVRQTVSGAQNAPQVAAPVVR